MGCSFSNHNAIRRGLSRRVSRILILAENPNARMVAEIVVDLRQQKAIRETRTSSPRPICFVNRRGSHGSITDEPMRPDCGAVDRFQPCRLGVPHHKWGF
jgi:hypothetical protein